MTLRRAGVLTQVITRRAVLRLAPVTLHAAPAIAWHPPRAALALSSRALSTAPEKDPRRPFARANNPGTHGMSHDTAEIERLLAARGDAKARKDYAAADQLAAQIAVMDVLVDDQRQEYWCVPAPIGSLNRKRTAARLTKDYAVSDVLRDEMVAAGLDFFGDGFGQAKLKRMTARMRAIP